MSVKPHFTLVIACNELHWENQTASTESRPACVGDKGSMCAGCCGGAKGNASG